MIKIDEHPYLMEHCGEGERLVRKTRAERVIQQALWAGLKPGMRVLDVGCGAGFTTSLLAGISGNAEGLDVSTDRIESARKAYPERTFHQRDIYKALDDLGSYDFIWIRFFLEYHRRSSFDILKRISGLLAKNGILCTAELDHHSLNHYPLEERMQKTLHGLSDHLQKNADWDPYAGRKLYTHLYDIGLENIELKLDAHHLIYGTMETVQESDWLTKLNVAAGQCGYPFDEYEGGFDEFLEDAEKLLADPRRFTYTPIIICRGVKPGA
ncbi:methyltransferase domain-containing protein [Marispirochaeta sp.]|jgi:SAM-dependent methyltransferase|uniref:methyltransferase domain-containing protein n=1 Tax=Marispirochaeta sp. TaxID=2038653 RepID=UPI0029C71A9D|nr:methyltransferase domain-containing protein [Marispirochaeta sp.]